jgi:antitoxin component of MazEF toxin-antitoxin module
MFTRKVYRKGGSLVVNIPKKLMNDLAWKAGDEVTMNLDARNRSINVKKVLF